MSVPKSRRGWTKDEYTELQRLRDTHTLKECEEILGHTVGSVGSAVQRLRIHGLERMTENCKTQVTETTGWSAADKALLRQYHQAGLSATVIAAKLGRTCWSITSAIRRMSLPDADAADHPTPDPPPPTVRTKRLMYATPQGDINPRAVCPTKLVGGRFQLRQVRELVYPPGNDNAGDIYRPPPLSSRLLPAIRDRDPSHLSTA